jgi:hypothetical protein
MPELSQRNLDLPVTVDAQRSGCPQRPFTPEPIMKLPLFSFVPSFSKSAGGLCAIRAAGGLLVLAGALMLGGCATGDYAYVSTISTGERIQIPLERGSPTMAKKGTLTVRNAALIPNIVSKNKELQFLFALIDSGTVPLKSVRVEDVTDEHALLMAEDLEPKVVNHQWSTTSRMFTAGEPALAWVAHLDNSMRIYRFTVVKSDGSTTVLDQGWLVPGWAKVPMRSALGLK